MAIQDWKKEFPQIGVALEKSRLQGRMGQGYLFVGDSASSLRTFATGWAMTASCQNPNSDGSACMKCRNCRAFAENTYTELILLEPQSKSRIIKIDALREFDRRLWLTTPENMLQVGIIADAECMTTEAQNALLKTLEEPPERTMMVLLTCQPNLLLPTIRSRCQTILLLKNRVDYTQNATEDFFKILGTLHRNAGTRAAFEASNAIAEILDNLHAKAQDFVDENGATDWENGEDIDDSMRKQLAQLKQERIASEYLRMRNALLECIQAWFQQRMLLAAKLPKEHLPQPEFASMMTPPNSMDEAREDLNSVAIYLQALRANVDESLALDAFCLSVCQKSGAGK